MNSNAWYRKVCGCFQEHIYLKEDETILKLNTNSIVFQGSMVKDIYFEEGIALIGVPHTGRWR